MNQRTEVSASPDACPLAPGFTTGRVLRPAHTRLGFIVDCCSVLVCALTWAAYAVVSQKLVHLMPVEVVGAWSRTFAMIILVGFALFRGEARLLWNPGPVVKYAILIGVIAFGMNAAQLYGLNMKGASASNFSVIVKMDVLFTLLATRFLLKERMFRLDYLGLVVMVSGVGLVMLRDLLHYEFAFVSDLLFLSIALGLTFNAFVIKAKLQVLSNRVVAGYNCSMSLLGFLVLLTATAQWGAAAEQLVHPRNMLLLASFGALIAGVFLTYYHALNRLPLWLVRVLLLFTPPFTMLLDFLARGTAITSAQVGGMLLIIAGACVIIVGHDRRRRFMFIEDELDS